MSSIIIDRRKNPHGKSLSNRQRFMERAKRAIRDAARKQIGGRSINSPGGADVNISSDGITEPRFRHTDDIGEWDYVLPGNKDYVPGDGIDKPPKNGGKSREGAPDGEGEDEFEFALSYDEYLNVIFDGLELPDLVKESEKNIVNFEMHRAGHTNVGIPANLNVERTAISGLGRRIALRSPKLAKIKELEEEKAKLEEILDLGLHPEFEEKNRKHILEIDEEISVLRRRAKAIGFLDDVDLRYNNFTKQPRPVTQAVMFCIMDVSGSMGEREKIISKKFFILLSLFLRRRYKNIDVVFIRHHDRAEEVDEETFFTGRETGGTIVSTAYEEMKKIIADRYPTDEWNIYLAQASDGDNWTTDNDHVVSCLTELLPLIQWFSYIEIIDELAPVAASIFGHMTGNSNLWSAIKMVKPFFKNMSMSKISNDREVVNVFRDLFNKDKAATK